MVDGQIVHEVVKHERVAAAAHGRLRTFLKKRGLLEHDDRRPEDIAIALIQGLEQDNLDLHRALGGVGDEITEMESTPVGIPITP